MVNQVVQMYIGLLVELYLVELKTMMSVPAKLVILVDTIVVVIKDQKLLFVIWKPKKNIFVMRLVDE